MTASEIFESVTGSGSTDFATLVRILDKHGRWCLVGGLAVNCYKVWAWSDPERRLTKRKKDELDLIRIGESYPEMRHLMPPVIKAQLETDAGADL
jgi:hypothetical protein